jgi:ligand-binding sensor domain-containing protein
MARALILVATATALLANAALTGTARGTRLRWEATGGPAGGRVREVVSLQSRLLLLGPEPGWRSADRVTRWEPLPELADWPSIFSANGDDLYADAHDGVIRTADLGDSWTPCGALPVNRTIGRAITSIRTDDRRVYVAISRVDLFRSEDRCATWSAIAVPWKTDVPPHIQYVDGPVVIARSTASFISNDAGVTWAPMHEHLAGAMTFTRHCDGTILAGTPRGVYRSANRGGSWTPAGLEGRWVSALVSPRCTEVVAVVRDRGRWTDSIFRSTDSGTTWNASSEGLPGHPVASLTADHNAQVYAAGAAGVFRWTGDSWQQVGPANVTVIALRATPRGDVLAAAGGDGLFRTRGPHGRWQKLLLGHKAHVAMHGPTGDSTAYAVLATGGDDLLVGTQLGVLKSDDGGDTWRRVGLHRIAYGFVQTAGGVILAGTDAGIFRSADGGETWANRSAGLASFRVGCLAAFESGDVYLGTWDGEVYRSTRESDRWTPLGGTASLGTSPVRALLAGRNGRVLAGTEAGVFGWDPDDRGWRAVAQMEGPQLVGVRALAEGARGAMFAGTAADGVFASVDGGATWTPANEGLAAKSVLSLAIDSTGDLVGGTPQGVFRARIDR